MQEEKIKLYEELLAADPGSRLFLPLARLYLERQETDKAISTLESGLTRYQEHFEARLVLHETLHEQGRLQEAREQLRMVSAVLQKYPNFWEHWADTMEAEGQLDAAVATRFLAWFFQERTPSWSEILRQGLREDFREGGDNDVGEPSSQAELETPSSGCGASLGAATPSESEGRDPYRTKTMADILVSQGDYAQALDIYSELQAEATSSRDREKLQEQIDWVKEQLEAGAGNKNDGEEEASSSEETELIPTLERLAERLENRRSL